MRVRGGLRWRNEKSHTRGVMSVIEIYRQPRSSLAADREGSCGLHQQCESGLCSKMNVGCDFLHVTNGLLAVKRRSGQPSMVHDSYWSRLSSIQMLPETCSMVSTK